MKYEVFFFANGDIIVINSKNQIPELQRKSIPVLFAEYVESKGYDPTDFQLNMTTGKATLFKTEYGWNWTFSKE